MENANTVQIRLLEGSDPPSIAAAFANMGWNKPEPQRGDPQSCVSPTFSLDPASC
jgi:hypothetical protein